MIHVEFSTGFVAAITGVISCDWTTVFCAVTANNILDVVF